MDLMVELEVARRVDVMGGEEDGGWTLVCDDGGEDESV